MEFAYRCRVCGLTEAWTTLAASQASAVWHMFEKHTDVWMAVMGPSRPRAPWPEVVGRKLEDWESQA